MKQKRLTGRMVQIVLRVPPDIEERLSELARLQYRSVASLLRLIIAEWLADHDRESRGPKGKSR